MTGTRRVRISREKLVGVVAALACLAFSAIGMKVYDTPDYMYVDGRREQPVQLEQAELTVGEVIVGTRLVDDGEVKAETPGMFVAVTATLGVPGSQKVILNSAQLVTQTRTYDNWSGTLLRAEPGFADTEQLYFEVDPAQIDDLTLEIWSSGVVHGFYARARIHLGITADNAEQWRQAARGREIPYQISGTTAGLR
ncbi:MAG TPA: hypothetical protein VFU98_10885 [Microlunatus sp.]|nr:hypothetical protein [Microlunatus sp.]